MARSPSRAWLLISLLAMPLRPSLGQASSTTVFRDVNLLPMTCECVLPHQTVVVNGGVISRVGPLAEVTVPAGARIVEGRGQGIEARGFHTDYALNHLGYALIDEKRSRDAEPLFELNSRLFPWSSNVWESLCEGYEAVADTVRARSSCDRAPALDAWNQDAQAVKARLAPH